jgi:hypothetical protein
LSPGGACVAQEAPPGDEAGGVERTPPRLSFVDGDVSFWRAGAEDWGPAQINTPLAPGDALYTAERANLELQIDARAFLRAGAGTQIGFENQEPDFLQFKVTTGHLSLDLRSLAPGHTVEVDTPNAAFSVDHTGYYRVDVDADTTTFITRRGGYATTVPADGEAVSIAPSEEAVITGTDSPQVETYVAPEVDTWDRWNYDRTDHLIDALSARYVPAGVYGVDALDHSGSWRVVGSYGPVWVPEGVDPEWAPYSTGQWIWDPYFGWTWVDEAPWGWAPYHYGRWVYIDDYWAWTPGPNVVVPVYAPALVAFLGGGFGVDAGIGVPPLGWVALGWGEPCLPWWGPRFFVGRPWWGGWGGPRVVNNVVVHRTTVVNANNINVYRNVDVRNAVIAVRQDRFGRDRLERWRLANIDPHRLEPLHGQLAVKPSAASLLPATGRAARPPQSVLQRSVVGTRAPHDPTAELRAAGLPAASSLPAPASRLVAAARRPQAALGSSRPPFGQSGAAERARPSLPPRFQESAPQEPVPLRGEPPRVEAPRVEQPRVEVPRGEPPPAQIPRVERPEPPARPLPGEPANRVDPGRGGARPLQMQAPQRAPAPHGGQGGGRSRSR